MLERQKAWQQRWRERHEREGTLYDAVAVVEDVIIGRSVMITCIVCAMLQDTVGIQHMLCTYMQPMSVCHRVSDCALMGAY